MRSTRRLGDHDRDQRNVANPIARMCAASDIKAIAAFSDTGASKLAAI